MTAEEEKLREALRRAHQADRPPPFSRMWGALRLRRRTPARRWAVASALAIAAALGVQLLRREAPPPSQIGQWRGPLDFLLQAPGSDLLATTPRFGAEVLP